MTKYGREVPQGEIEEVLRGRNEAAQKQLDIKLELMSMRPGECLAYGASSESGADAESLALSLLLPVKGVFDIITRGSTTYVHRRE